MIWLSSGKPWHVTGFSIYGTSLAVLGLAAVGAAAYFYFTAPDEHVVVSPAVAHDHIGAAVMGRF